MTAAATPGRLSFAQSKERSQKRHWTLQRGATGRWARAAVAECEKL
jgi:hypothetical protein